ncbi:hypothetical protein [Nocardiopsis sp. CC223A]|uniref:hypothetical protein n=1 Tax=Nocardiopsis sp. CC223A TaxID=3044051 RepID=UPI00278C749A|nr:hypothetical protein [Nocardiopsis sp. CC223A]
MTPSHHRPESASHPPERAARIRRIRRYAVPRAMIERATGRRLAGDWRGACAAANVDVDLDPDRIRAEHGAEFADALLDDLRHLVPDLVRWHFPRLPHGPVALALRWVLLLARPGGDGGPWLAVETAYRDQEGPQRLRLSLREDFDGLPGGRGPHPWIFERYLWDARRAHEARERWGGSTERAPFLNPDGTPRTVRELPAADPGDADPAARTEWIDHLHQTGRVAEAFAAAGFLCDAENLTQEGWTARVPVSPARLAAELTRLHAAGPAGRTGIPLDYRMWLTLRAEGGRFRAEVEPFVYKAERRPSLLPELFWGRPPDIDALRDGMSPDHLHPLVRDALAPARPPADGPLGPPPWTPPAAPVRVRCRGEWHTVAVADGRLSLPHAGEEKRREASLRALGGASAGCFAVEKAWTTGAGRLPKALRALRADLFERVLHGDTDAVVHYLDAGGDPHVRNGDRSTLLHHLHCLDHEVLLPRLLAAGLDVDAEDHQRHTPLGRVMTHGGSARLGRALIAAGARTEDVIGAWWGPRDLSEVIRRRMRFGAPTAVEAAELAALGGPL